MGSAGRIHGLVIQHDLHATPFCFFHSMPNKVHVFSRQIGDAAGQSLAGMNNKPCHAMGLEIINLSGNFIFSQFIIPEPEGHGRKFIRRG